MHNFGSGLCTPLKLDQRARASQSPKICAKINEPRARARLSWDGNRKCIQIGIYRDERKRYSNNWRFSFSLSVYGPQQSFQTTKRFIEIDFFSGSMNTIQFHLLHRNSIWSWALPSRLGIFPSQILAFDMQMLFSWSCSHAVGECWISWWFTQKFWSRSSSN